MTAATTPAPAAHRRKTGFADTLASEWTKLRSVRSTYVQVLIAVGLGLSMTALLSLAIGSSFDQLSAEDRANFDPASVGAFGAVFALISLIVLGVTSMSSEYTSGMIRLTLATTPRRLRVLAAKSLLVLAVSLVVGFVLAFVSFPIGQAVLGAYDGVPTTSLSDKEALTSVIAQWLTTPVFPRLGLAAATVLRSTASAITAVLVFIFVPSVFGPLFPDAIIENGLRFLPNFAVDNLVNQDPDAATHLSRPVAALVVLAWLAFFFEAAYFSLTERDA
jgi:hypothetical protein